MSTDRPTEGPAETMRIEVRVTAVRKNLRAALTQATLAARETDPMTADALSELAAAVLEAPERDP